MKTRITKRIFTLIELLVVLSVIIILTSLLITALSKVNKTTEELGCMNNLAQVGTALHSYSTDHNNNVPYPDNPSSGDRGLGSRGPKWENRLAAYLGSESSGSDWLPPELDTFVCPASPIEQKKDENDGRFKYYHDGILSQYNSAYEGMYGVFASSGLANSSRGMGMLKISYHEKPQGLPVQFCSRRESPVWRLHSTYGNNVMGAAGWHDETGPSNRPTLFMDGHVKALEELQYIKHWSMPMVYGPYSSGELIQGIAYGSKPQHKPGDFWLDEY